MIRPLTPQEALGEIRETVYVWACEALTAEEAMREIMETLRSTPDEESGDG